MNYLKYTQYAYLIAGILFIYEGITKMNVPNGNGYLFLAMGVVAIAMFFFRRKFAKKFENRDNKQ